MLSPRKAYLATALAIILIGVLSRTLHSGTALLDKYLGDALYAALLYLVLRAIAPARAPGGVALAAFGLVAAIEVFQISGIPARMARSGNPVLRLGAIVLGTGFSWYDLAAYAVGVLAVYLADRLARHEA